MAESNAAVPSPKRTEARYSNSLQVGYNAFEVVLDFGQFYPDAGDDSIHTRIVTTPAYAKQFSELLSKSLAEYEQKFGPLQAGEE